MKVGGVVRSACVAVRESGEGVDTALVSAMIQQSAAKVSSTRRATLIWCSERAKRVIMAGSLAFTGTHSTPVPRDEMIPSVGCKCRNNKVIRIASMARSMGRMCRMLPARNMARRVAVRECNMRRLTVLIALAAVLWVSGGRMAPAWGQTVEPLATGQGETLQAPRVDISHAQEAARTVANWVALGRPPQMPQGRAMAVTGLSAVRVTLRWQGVMVGRGDAVADERRPAADLIALCHDATAAALRATGDYLERQRNKALIANPDAAAHPAETPETIGHELSVDLQIALAMEPIRLREGDKPETILTRFVPGYHGLRFRRRQAGTMGDEHWIWPASALASNTSPGSQIVQSLSRLDYDINDPKRAVAAITGPDAPQVERFMVIHLTGPASGEKFTRLIRGNVPRQPTSLDDAGVARLTRRIAAHLTDRVSREGRVAGEFSPASDQWSDTPPSDAEAALTALALARWGRACGKTDASGDKAALAASRILDRFKANPRTPSPAASAILLLAIPELPNPGDYNDYRSRLVSDILKHRTKDGTFTATAATHEDEASQSTPVVLSVPETALVVAGLARVYDQTRDADLGRAVAVSQAKLWATTPPDRIGGLMPWVGITEALLADVQDDGIRDAHRDGSARLLDLARGLRELQVTSPPSSGPDDVLGGIEMKRVPVDVVPAPDWRTAQVLAYWAIMLRSRGVLPEEDRLPTLLACGLAARFLDGLAFDDDACFFVRFPAYAVGGVRLSFWDNRLPLSPSAMALFALAELRVSLDELAPASKPAAAP